MFKVKNFLALILALLMVLSFGACSKRLTVKSKIAPAGEVSQKKQVTLTVSAASSLKDTMNEIKEVYLKEHPDVHVIYNFASAGSLQRQIENGASVDLFISAAQKQMDDLMEKGLLDDETRINLLGNNLVLVVPNDSVISLTFSELGEDKIKKLALGEPKSVPVGQYAEEVLNNLKIKESVMSKAIYSKDVKEVLTWVETGNVDAGIVYGTDAKASQKVKVVATAPDGSHKPILYPAGIIKSSKNKESAKIFLSFLASEKGKATFQKYGFKFLVK